MPGSSSSARLINAHMPLNDSTAIRRRLVSRGANLLRPCKSIRASPVKRSKSVYRDILEVMLTEWIHDVAFHFLTHRLVHGGVCDNQRRSLIVHHHLRLLVQFDALVVVGFGARRLNQIFKRLVAPAGVVGAVFRRRAAEQRGEEVVRIPVVAGQPIITVWCSPALARLRYSPHS